MNQKDDEPEFLRNDPGLECLLAQLERVNLQIEKHERFKEQMAEATKKRTEEFRFRLERAESKSSQPISDSETTAEPIEVWETHWDDAVGAEYYFNPRTGEATWLPPPSHQLSST